MSKILDAGKWRPPTRTVFVDGEAVLEKLPSVRSRRYLDLQGNVRFLALGNANIAAEDGVRPYADEQMRYKQSLGWVPAGACPAALVVSQQILPDRVSKKAREGAPCAPGSYSLESPCHHFAAEMEIRRARHAGKMDELDAKWNAEDRARGETQDKLNSVLEKLTDKLVDQSDTAKPKRGKAAKDA